MRSHKRNKASYRCHNNQHAHQKCQLKEDYLANVTAIKMHTKKPAQRRNCCKCDNNQHAHQKCHLHRRKCCKCHNCQHANQKGQLQRINVADVTLKMHTKSVLFREEMVAAITRMKRSTLQERHFCVSHKICKKKRVRVIFGQFLCCEFFTLFHAVLLYFIHFLLYFMLFFQTRK